jgi:fatty aldehyde-generating acyl-ACP reductase
MEKFAFMIHPIELSDIYRKLKFMQKIPDRYCRRSIIKKIPPLKVSHITGVKSQYSVKLKVGL